MKAIKKLRQRITHEGRLTWLTVGAAAPAAIVALACFGLAITPPRSSGP